MAKKKTSTPKKSIGVANPGAIKFYEGSDDQTLVLYGFAGDNYNKKPEVQNFKIQWMVLPIGGTIYYPASESSSAAGGFPTFDIPSNCVDVYANVSVESVKHTDKCKPSGTALQARLEPGLKIANRVSAPSGGDLTLKNSADNFYVFTATVSNYSDTSGGQAYQIEFEFNNESGPCGGTKIGDSTNGIASVEFTGQAGHEYRLRVRALAIPGTKFRDSTWSSYSQPVKTKPAQVAIAPTLEPQIRTTEAFPIKVSWGAADGAETYHIEWTKNKDWFDINTSEVHSEDTQTATTSIIVSDGLDTSGGGLWYFRVRGHNSAGDGAYSPLATITIGTPPAAPTTWSYETVLEIGQGAHLCWTHNSEDGSPMTAAKLAYKYEGIDPIAEHIPTEALTILLNDFMTYLPAATLEGWYASEREEPVSGEFTSPETERVFTYAITYGQSGKRSEIGFDDYSITYNPSNGELSINQIDHRPKTVTFKNYKDTFVEHFPFFDYFNVLHRNIALIDESHGDLTTVTGNHYGFDNIGSNQIWYEFRAVGGDLVYARVGRYMGGGNTPGTVVLENDITIAFEQDGPTSLMIASTSSGANNRTYLHFARGAGGSTYSSPYRFKSPNSVIYDPEPYNEYFGTTSIQIVNGHESTEYIYGPYNLSDKYIDITKIHYDAWEGEEAYDVLPSNDYYVNVISITQPPDPTKAIKTYMHLFPTTGLSDSQKVYWKVATRGVLDRDGPEDDGFGEYSVERSFTVYSPPSVTLTVEDGGIPYEGNPIGEDAQIVTSFPLTIKAHGEPNTQTPIGYNFQIISRGDYDVTDDDGTEIHVTNGEVVWERYFATDKHHAQLELGAGAVFLQNQTLYSVHVEYTTSIGLSAEASIDIYPYWNIQSYSINADVAVDVDNLVAFVRPFITDENEEELTDGVFFSVYRRDPNGEMIELASHLDAANNTTITDIHPALDFARYRVVAIDKGTGVASFADISGAVVGEKGIVIHWDEAWQRADEGTPDINFMLDVENQFAGGSLLKLPYNVDVADDFTKETSLIYYAGRRYPVSYYGDQRTLSSTWSTSVPKRDTETMHAIRRLAMYGGDSYVREPNGTGYWASVSISYSISHNNPLVPVSIKISRVAEHEDAVSGESSAIIFTSEDTINNGTDSDDAPLEDMGEDSTNYG